MTSGSGSDASPLVLVRDPAGTPVATLARAGARAGAVGVVDVATAADVAAVATAVPTSGDGEVAVRAPLAAAAVLAGAPASLTVVLDAREADDTAIAAAVTAVRPHDRVLVEVTSVDAARAALAAGADGVVTIGSEAGGRVGTTEASILLQQVVAVAGDALVVAGGGIGLHTAAAAVAGGAGGVLLDSQLALVRESGLDDDVRAAVSGMDGSETRLVGGHRIYTRPDLPAAAVDEHASVAEVADRLGPTLADLVPMGTDAAMAAGLARRFGTVGGVVQAVRASVATHLAAAREHEPLAPGRGLSAPHGTRFPIAQGPMTRVSDRADFALSVAEAGGLPFLALALLTGPEVRDLLTETAERLGDHPWGVGILGFVPPEVREAQLEVVHDIAPPMALIAGGRPSQAKPLEEVGIATYLHVPSPGLLDRFLKDGARRFVFEGRECGGHVGPRSSFDLWDAQIERLLRVDDPESLHVLFAGGIHDGRSAAMVAAAAAPLAARGAHLGVLMGTAYLFTPEAVVGGAITETFQQVAVDCERTVLLETAPGHATRCVETDYVRAFQARRDELVAAGVDAHDRWAELETLNLGRLRMASKGLTREGGAIVELDDDAQRRDGMFMIGDVATLQHEVRSIEALHRDVTEGSGAVLAATAAAPVVRARTAPSPLDVAVVGMASMLPGSSDGDRFWANVVGGVDSVTEVPAERWDVDTYFSPDAVTVDPGRKTPSRWGGFLDAVGFDPLAYGIPPASLAAVEPVQLLALEVANRALADAGYATREFDRERASVVFGAESGNDLAGAYGFRAYWPQLFGALPAELEEYLPAYTEDSFPGVLTNVIAGRIANRLDLGGINYTLDAACASSLAAVDAACKELVGGTSDVVLCGGADLHNGLNDYLLFASVHALSPTGRCRTFDADADGIALGEGIAVVVLKRRVDAERDGDRIYAVIDAVAGSSDGRHLGLTAPRKEGQQRAVVRALDQAGHPATAIGLVEAHGTGTVVGDRTELATLTELYRSDGAAPGSIVVGSVKSQIGHTKCAAGLAGMIKAVRAVHHGVLPPTVNVVSPNPYHDADTSPFRLLDTARPWLSDDRRAAISAFGFGGTNFHAIISAAGPEVARHGLDEWPAELVLVRAASAEAATDRLAQLATVVGEVATADPRGQRHRLRDLARTISDGVPGEPVQVALVASSLVELASSLGALAAGDTPDGAFRADALGGDVAFLYPGQGSQRPGMLNDLFVAFPTLRSVLVDGAEWADAMLPPAAFGIDAKRAQQAALTATDVAQPTLGLAAMAMTRLLASVGVAPALVGGHSYGELAALHAAGAFSDADLLALSAARGRAIVDTIAASAGDPGTMAAVRLGREQADERVAAWPDVVIANHNGPDQVVISGPTAAVEAAIEALTADGVKAKRLPVACAFHSPVVAAAADAFAATLATVEVGEPTIPVWSNVTASPHTSADEVPALLARQLAEGVRFVDQVEAMYAAGARVFVEAGPGRVLTQSVAGILGDRPHRVVATDVSGEAGVPRFLLALAELAALGVPVDVTSLFAERAAKVDLRTLPVAAPGWTVDGMLTRTAAGAPVAGGLKPATERPRLAAPSLGGSAAGGPAGAGDPTVLEYLRGVRELVAAQRDVMLGYLGASVTPSAPLAAVIDVSPTNRVLATPDRQDLDRVTQEGVVPRGEVLLGVVLDLVSDRTGYPVEMLDPDLDLEADLSIDSIKRIEIIGELADTIGLADGAAIDESVIDDLAAIKTLRGIVAWIDDLTANLVLASADRQDLDPVTQELVVPRGEALLEVVLTLVSDRTGYPVEMLDPDLDLEADLSIDSIKRIEIIGELADTIGLADGDAIDESVVDDLAAIKTLRGIVAWIDDLTAPAERVPASATGEDRPSATPERDVGGDGPGVPDATVRYEVHDVVLGPVADTVDLRGVDVVLVVPADADDRGPATLAGLIEPTLLAAGATAEVVAADAVDRIGRAGAVVHLADVVPGADVRTSFAALRAAALGAPTRILALTSSGSATGLPGLVKALGREVPATAVRLLELDPTALPADPDGVAARIVAELADTAGPVEVEWRAGARIGRAMVAVPALDPAAVPDLGPDAVVLVTGGARGITATVTTALARATGARLVLVGSSPEPGPEDPRLADAADAPALRQALVATGEHGSLAEIEAAVRRVTADRQIRATLGGLDETGIKVEYVSLDVRDGGAVAALVADVVDRHGRLDGIVHGAGVLDDRLLAAKTDEGFARVVATKVDPARALLDHLPASCRFVLLFGSISGVVGNRGQSDYGAANDALDRLARARTSAACRVLSIDWGPWAGGGMVSPELEREYTRRGIGLVGPDEGIALVLAELAGVDGPAQVVAVRATPEALDPDGTVLARP